MDSCIGSFAYHGAACLFHRATAPRARNPL